MWKRIWIILGAIVLTLVLQRAVFACGGGCGGGCGDGCGSLKGSCSSACGSACLSQAAPVALPEACIPPEAVQAVSECGGASGPSVQTVSLTAVNVGNTRCPVRGDAINEQFKATYEYDGKIYNFCCPGCIGVFKAEPQKYILKVEEELSSLR